MELDFNRMPPLAAQHVPRLPLSSSRFIPAPAVEKSPDPNEASFRENTQGSNPGSVRLNAKFSGPPDNCDPPGHLPFTSGAA
eukprot:7474634-Pyramimonas_sp.AAC.1